MTMELNFNLNPTDGLERVLAEQLKLYEQYAECLKSDREYMAKLKVEELEKNNKLKNTLLLKVQAMDEARKAYVKQIALEKQIPEENVKIADLCRVLSPDVSARLQNIRDRLQAAIHSLKKVQTETTLLAHSSLAWINSSMATLKSLLTPTGTYNLQGKVDHPHVFAGRVVERQA